MIKGYKYIYIYLSLSMAEPCQTNRNETRYLQCPGDDWNLAIIVLPHVTIAMIHVTFRKKSRWRETCLLELRSCLQNPSTCEIVPLVIKLNWKPSKTKTIILSSSNIGSMIFPCKGWISSGLSHRSCATRWQLRRYHLLHLPFGILRPYHRKTWNRSILLILFSRLYFNIFLNLLYTIYVTYLFVVV